MSDDLVYRLNALADCEHDDLSVGAEAAQRIISLTGQLIDATENQQWVSVDDEWPPSGVEVLWYRKDALGADHLLHTFNDSPGKRSLPSFGTHWMPLPEPPQEKGDG